MENSRCRTGHFGTHCFPVTLTAEFQDIFDELHIAVYIDRYPEQQPFNNNCQHQDGAAQQWIHYRPAAEEKINHDFTVKTQYL
jgi:hypothetical protein